MGQGRDNARRPSRLPDALVDTAQAQAIAITVCDLEPPAVIGDRELDAVYRATQPHVGTAGVAEG